MRQHIKSKQHRIDFCIWCCLLSCESPLSGMYTNHAVLAANKADESAVVRTRYVCQIRMANDSAVPRSCVPLLRYFCVRSPAKTALICMARLTLVFPPFVSSQTAVSSFGNRTASVLKSSVLKLGFPPACSPSVCPDSATYLLCRK